MIHFGANGLRFNFFVLHIQKNGLNMRMLGSARLGVMHSDPLDNAFSCPLLESLFRSSDRAGVSPNFLA